MIILEGITKEEFFKKIESIIDKKLDEKLAQQNLRRDLKESEIDESLSGKKHKRF